MTFAAPGFVWAAAAAAAVTVALHLLAWRRPPETLLPTARFAPDVPVRTVSRALRPADLLLLGLRVMLVLLVGAALGRPTLRSRTPGVARVVVVDQSRGSQVTVAVADSARSWFRAGDALVSFDSSAREIPGATRDSIRPVTAPRGSGSVSAALITAIRAARRLTQERDSVEIVVVSPFDVDELDAATSDIRRIWPGAIRLIRSRGLPNDSMVTGRLIVRAPPGDPVAAALGLSAPDRHGGDVRVVRDALTASDNAWAEQGHAVVVWPSSAAATAWISRAPVDTGFGVSATATPAALEGDRAATIVAPMARTIVAPAGRVIARWQDGEPAATERALGLGCIRAVAVIVPVAGDLALTPAFRRFAVRLTTPCESMVEAPAISDSALVSALPVANASAASTASLTDGVDAGAPTSRLSVWLFALAIVAALAELVVRRGASNATA